MGEGTRDARGAAAAPTALVTGAAGHLGVELCRLLVAAGYAVVGVDQPGGVRPTGVQRWVELDLAAPSSEAQLSAALDAGVRVDLVVAAAGVTALGSVDVTDDATFRRVMDVNYHGMLRTVRAALPGLRAARGHLVVVSSVAGLLPVVGRPAYVGAKHAVSGVARALAGELEADGVAVTVVHPAFLATPVTEVGAGRASRSTTGAALTPGTVARAIVRAAVRRRAGGRAPARLQVGATAHLADAVVRLAPETARRLAARRLRAR